MNYLPIQLKDSYILASQNKDEEVSFFSRYLTREETLFFDFDHIDQT